jgi:biotin carboxylase
MQPSLLIVGGGLLQVPAVERAKELGYFTIVTDKNENAPAFSICDEKIFLSSKDIEGHELLAKKFRETKNLAGVYTQGTDVEYTVARAANYANLPGISVDAAQYCNNKILMRTRLSEQNVDNAKFFAAKTLDNAYDAVKNIGIPCILKPADNSASRGVTIIHSESEIKNAFEVAINSCFHEKTVIIEEFFDGEEYSVDTIVWDGIVYPCGISDREFLKSENYAVQSGSLTPSLLPEHIQNEMYELMQSAATAVGVDKGAFKGDLIIVNGKPRIIEVTARTSGGFDSQYRKPYSFGIDLIKATIDIAVGKKLDFSDIVPRWFKWSKTFSIFPKPGKIIRIDGIEEAKKIPGVKNIFITAKENDIIPDYVHSATRVNHIIIVEKTFHDLNKLQEKVKNTIKYTIE